MRTRCGGCKYAESLGRGPGGTAGAISQGTMADTNSTIAPANPADRITAGTHFEADGLTLSCIAGKPGFATADLRPRLASPAWSDPSANVFGWHGTTGQIAGLIGRGRWTSAPCSK